MNFFIFLNYIALLTSSGSAIPADETAIRRRISDGVNAIRLIDTHEHLPPETDRIKKEASLFTTLHYVSSDMWADGMEREASDRILNDSTSSLEKKWQTIAPYWNNVRTTAYGRGLLRAIRDLHGINDINESTYPEISRKIKAANRAGWYEMVLKKKAGIELAICDVGQAGATLDPDLFRAVIRLDYFLIFPQGARVAQQSLGVTVDTLAEWESALIKAFEQAKAQKFAGIKSAVAYNRSLDFGVVNRNDAETLFNRLKDQKPGMPDWNQNKLLQDYMFGKIAEACARFDLPLQIHTGLFYDPWRNVSQADPSLLIPFIIRHKNTRFVLMHGGYPYGGQLLAMAKNLPNVSLDMCWTYIISPTFAGRFLDEAIETVPADKVLGFGGDYQVAEGSYAHAMLCREVVSKVLADKVVSGYWSEAEALGYAKALLRDNAIKAFKLQK